VSTTLAALGAGAAALLEAEGRPALAELVRRARVEIVGPGETWSMGAREVTAHRVALAVPAEAFHALTSDPAALGAVRSAFARAMRSPDTELSEVHVELLLPVIDRAWAHAYRSAPTRDPGAERPSPEAVLAGAAALLRATGDPLGAAILEHSHLSVAEVASAGTPLTRVVVYLTPQDRARTWHAPALEERLRRAVHDAVRRAQEEAVVELAVLPA